MLTILGAIALVAIVYGVGWWLVNHGNPVLRFLGRHPRLRFALVVATTVAVGALAFLVLFYPERLFGVEGGELGSSLSRSLKNGSGGECRPEGGDSWRCAVDVGGASEATSRTYELNRADGACWDATQAQAGKAPSARDDTETVEGCVGLMDYVAPENRSFAE